MVGIIGAMEEEVTALKSKMNIKEVKQIKNLEFYIGLLHNKEVIVVRCGIGKVNAALCTQIMIDNFNIHCIINTGVAGSLNKKLNIGDIVISSNAVEHDFDTTAFGDPIGYISRMGMEDAFFKSDKQLVDVAKKAGESIENINTFVGTVATGDQFISSKEAKNKIKDNFDAYCAEMEGAAIAHACYINQIPFVIIRAISDKADEKADISFDEFTDLASKNSSNMIEKIVSMLNL